MVKQLLFILCTTIYAFTVNCQSKLIRSEFRQSRLFESSLIGNNEKILYKDVIYNPVCVKIDKVNKKIYWSNAGSRELNRSDMDGTNVETLSRNSIEIKSIDFDYTNGKIYYGDINVAKIVSINFDGSGEKYIYQNNSGGGVFGLVLLPEINLIYFTSGSSIYSSKLDGSNVVEILGNLKSPKNLVYDKTKKELYFEEQPFSTAGSIKKCDINGMNVSTIISTNINSPQGFQIDFNKQKIYWINGSNSNLYKANLDGSNEELVIDISSGSVFESSIDFGIDNKQIFWIDRYKSVITSANIDGTEIKTIVQDNLDEPYEVNVDNLNKKLYVVDYNHGIFKSNIDGSQIELIVKTPYLRYFAIDSTNLYYYNYTDKKIFKANLDGTNRIPILSGLNSVYDIEIDKKNKIIYWIDASALKIFKANLDGTGKQALVGISSYAWSLSIDEKNEKIFWSNRNIGQGEIMSANFDGSNVKTITKGYSQYLSWIKVDNSKEYIYWTENEWNSSLHKAKLDGTGHELILGMKNQLRGFDFFYIDNDNDGFASDLDCDDNNSTINPGASEICDGKDNNCNGSIDDGLPQFTFYEDKDNDGYGNLAVAKSECSNTLPTGFVTSSTDCDDTNPNINPSATDIANNGIDENCDGINFTSSVYDYYASKISVFPNPTSSSIYISCSDETLIDAAVYTCTGVKIKDVLVESTTDISELNAGIYLLQFKIKGLSIPIHKKLVIQK